MVYLMASKAHYQVVPSKKKSQLMKAACHVKGARVAEAEGVWGSKRRRCLDLMRGQTIYGSLGHVKTLAFNLSHCRILRRVAQSDIFAHGHSDEVVRTDCRGWGYKAGNSAGRMCRNPGDRGWWLRPRW